MPPDATAAIRLSHLSKHYGRVSALKDVTLDVRPGEIFGFLGLNGAGKTTTIRILLDLVRPSAGQAFIFGVSCQARGLDVRAKLGYLPGELGFYGDMTGEATLDVLSRLAAATIDYERRRDLLARVELSEKDLRRRIREYSTGMKRKLGIVQAFQSDAPLLILDEPTEGLDPLMQDAVYALLADTRRRGRTVFMSSHVLPEVERVCDRIAVLRQGELVLVTGVEEMRRLAPRGVRVVFGRGVDPPRMPLPDGCELLSHTPTAWDLQVRGELGPLIATLAALPVADVEVREPHLEGMLKQYYQGGRG